MNLSRWPHWVSDDGAITLVCGDALQVLPGIERSAGMILLSDPPYGISHSSNHGASWQGTEIEGDEDTSARDAALAWWGECGPWAMFGTWKVATPATARGVLVWDKGPAFGMGDLSFPWKPSWEEIAVGGYGWNGKRDEGVVRGHLVVSWESKGRLHPHEKPVSLFEYLLSKTGAGIVVDPFVGSGTSMVAAVRGGLRGIACEIDRSYYEIAKARIQEELRLKTGSGPLFGKLLDGATT